MKFIALLAALPLLTQAVLQTKLVPEFANPN